MNELAKENYFEDAVSEYTVKKGHVVKTFITWCIELGAILYKHREIMKAKNRRLEYCSEIGLHITQANDQIRLYQYARERNEDEVLGKVLTNWWKLKMFLTLPAEYQESVLASEEINEETSTEEFREIVSKIKDWDEVEEEIKVPDNVPTTPYNQEIESTKALLENVEQTAKLLVRENELSWNVYEHIKWVLYIQKALLCLSDPYSISEEEKGFVRKHLESQVENIQSILEKYS